MAVNMRWYNMFLFIKYIIILYSGF